MGLAPSVASPAAPEFAPITPFPARAEKGPQGPWIPFGIERTRDALKVAQTNLAARFPNCLRAGRFASKRAGSGRDGPGVTSVPVRNR